MYILIDLDMTPEDKQLLLKDLCARLPYGVKLHIEYYDLQGDEQLKERDIELTHGNISHCFGCSYWSDFKPYLRPMSSMTEEEEETMRNMATMVNAVALVEKLGDWLNSRHFDYRRLIPKGLALEAPADMYKTK